MGTDDLSQPLEAVVRAERKPRLRPLKIQDHMDLFEEWARLNPDAMREMELVALAIDARGMRVSAKYLIERQRYEGSAKLVPVTYCDESGAERTYGINNYITPMLARWLLERHPKMRILTRKSLFDRETEETHEA